MTSNPLLEGRGYVCLVFRARWWYDTGLREQTQDMKKNNS